MAINEPNGMKYTLSQRYMHRWHFSTIFWDDVYKAERLFNCETGSFPSNMAVKWQMCNIYWPQIVEEDCGLGMFPNVQDDSNNLTIFNFIPAWKQERLLTSEIIINIIIKIKNENLKKHVNQELCSCACQRQKSDTKRQKLGLLLL